MFCRSHIWDMVIHSRFFCNHALNHFFRLLNHLSLLRVFHLFNLFSPRFKDSGMVQDRAQGVLNMEMQHLCGEKRCERCEKDNWATCALCSVVPLAKDLFQILKCECIWESAQASSHFLTAMSFVPRLEALEQLQILCSKLELRRSILGVWLLSTN